MKRKGTLRRQTPIRGGRERLGAALERRVEQRVVQESLRHGVTKPFVISVALADYFGIKIEDVL